MAGQKVTEEQADGALRQLLGTEPEAAPATEAAVGEAPVETEQAEEAAPAEEVQQDDIESLRKRLADFELRDKERETASSARADAMQRRFAENGCSSSE